MLQCDIRKRRTSNFHNLLISFSRHRLGTLNGGGGPKPKREVLEVMNVERNDENKHIGNSIPLYDDKWSLNPWKNIQKIYRDYTEMQEALKPFEDLPANVKNQHKYHKLDERGIRELILLIPFRKWFIILKPALSEACHTYYIHFHGAYIGKKYKEGDVIKILREDEISIRKEIEKLTENTEDGKELDKTKERQEEISRNFDKIISRAQGIYKDHVSKVNNIQDVVQETVKNRDNIKGYLIDRLQIVGEVLHVFMQSYKEGKEAAVKDAVSNDGIVDQLAAAAAEVERGFERERIKKEEEETKKNNERTV